MKKLLFFLIFAFFSSSGLFCRPQFVFDVSGIYSSLDAGDSESYLGTPENAFAGGVFLECRPFRHVGAGAGINFSSYRQNESEGDSMDVSDSFLGVRLNFPVTGRLDFSCLFHGGIYDVAFRNSSFSGISFGARGEVAVKATPSLSVFSGVDYSSFCHSDFPFSTLNAFAGVRINLPNLFSYRGNVSAFCSRLDPVFPALYSWYDENPFAEICIKNGEDADIYDVRVSFFQEEFMTYPKQSDVIGTIRKGQSASASLRAFFNESILNLIEPVVKNAEVMVSYKILGVRKQFSVPINVVFFNRNNMNWEDDRRAAVFVCANDAEALEFAKKVSTVVRNSIDSSKSRSLQLAMAIFESLNLYGMNYVVDPSSSYSSNVSGSSIDFLQFPYQTLNYHGGDCDDMSILYCSLCSVLGIETCFITVPGHIYCGVCIEKTEDELSKGDLPAMKDDLIYYDGRIWQPVEITMMDEGFSRAADFGASEWKKARDEARIYPIYSCWKEYKSVSSPEEKVGVGMPPKSAILEAFRAQQKKLLR